jgi:hypothetical protein
MRLYKQEQQHTNTNNYQITKLLHNASGGHTSIYYVSHHASYMILLNIHRNTCSVSYLSKREADK